MIKSIKIVNFRNFSRKELFFSCDKNCIIGENGNGKTNILESISVITNNTILGLNFEDLVKKDEKVFFIEIHKESDALGISFDREENKKKFFINGKITTKTKFKEFSPKSVIFSPLTMNMFYLGPTLRRDFLDNILINSFINYEKILKKYKNIIKSRNKVLKNIFENKSKKEEINFWDEQLINESIKIYEYRIDLIDFIKNNLPDFLSYFNGKIQKIEFIYKTKVNFENIHFSIKEYLSKNLDRDIILKKTSIGPHIDDFDILVDDIPLIRFVSRGEAKSVVLGLKLLEIKFLEKNTLKKPVLLIDDLISELDENHKNLLLENIVLYQSFITSISDLNLENTIFI